jgi:hypothetical protein
MRVRAARSPAGSPPRLYFFLQEQFGGQLQVPPLSHEQFACPQALQFMAMATSSSTVRRQQGAA